MAGGLPPGAPPPLVPGMTAGAPPASAAVPPDQISSILDKARNRRGSAQELIKTAVMQLEQAATMDSALKDRIGAALSLLRGPKKPGEKPDNDDDK